MHYAAMNGHVEATLCCCINDRGTDPVGERAWALQQQSANGWSALHIAAFEGKKPVDVSLDVFFFFFFLLLTVVVVVGLTSIFSIANVAMNV